jgi:hypothetical protein
MVQFLILYLISIHILISFSHTVGRSRALLDGKSVKKIKPPLKKSKFHWTKNIDELHELFENYELRKQICLKLIHDQFTTLWELWNIIYDLTLRVVDFKVISCMKIITLFLYLRYLC